MSERQEDRHYSEQRPDWSKDPKKIVWNMLYKQRNKAKETMDSSDMLMQALEAAPELEEAFQIAFNLQQGPMQTPASTQGGGPQGYRGGAPR